MKQFFLALLTVCAANAFALDLSCPEEIDWLFSTKLNAPPAMAVSPTLLNESAVAKHALPTTQLLSAVLRKDFPAVNSIWDRIESLPQNNDNYRNFSEIKYLVDGKGGLLLPYFEDWSKEYPTSNAAKLFIALAYLDAAQQARGTATVSQTDDRQLVIARSRRHIAMKKFEPLAAQTGLAGLIAYEMLMHQDFLNRRDKQAVHRLNELSKLLPGHGWLYLDAMSIVGVEWVGKSSDKLSAAVLESARLSSLDPVTLATLTQMRRDHANRVRYSPQPQEWRNYWQQRTEAAPSIYNRVRWLGWERYVENWPAVIELTDLILKDNPHHRTAIANRAQALEAMGKQSQAWDVLVEAMARGDDTSLSTIIYAHIKGTHDRKPKDFDAMYEYCKLGVALGLASGFQCVGSSHLDGFAGVSKDREKSIPWLLTAARGGHSNAQHDLVMVNPNFSLEERYFWLTEAARQGHSFAVSKLQSMQAPDRSVGCRVKRIGQSLVQLINNLREFRTY